MPSACAQANASVVGGTVSGHVVCGDTDGPARFARVFLKSTSPEHAGDDFMKEIEDSMKKAAEKSGKPLPAKKEPTEDQKRQRAAAARGMNEATALLSASTVGMDGAYRFSGVKPGTYYVHAVLPGYVDPYTQLSDADFESSDPAVRARIAALPTVTVSGTETARVDLRLARGAAVSGRVRFDDGTPAVGWTVWAIRPGVADNLAAALNPTVEKQVAQGMGKPIADTDDRGAFRIAGLPDGSYVLRATLAATPVGVSGRNLAQAGSGIRLTVYSGDTFDLAAAKPVTVREPEERTVADITVHDRRLHSLVGHVMAQTDNHSLNMGQVSLSSRTDTALHLKATIRDDGSFQFDYLPGNTTYTLAVSGAADAAYTPSDESFMGISMPKSKVLQTYGAATQDVVLGDEDNIAVRFALPAEGKRADLRDAPAE